jgi:hypothetical protein
MSRQYVMSLLKTFLDNNLKYSVVFVPIYVSVCVCVCVSVCVCIFIYTSTETGPVGGQILSISGMKAYIDHI